MQIDILNVIEGKKYTIDKSMVVDNCIFGDRVIRFKNAIHLVGSYVCYQDMLVLQAVIKIVINADCDRCGKDCEIMIDIPFEETFKKGAEDNSYGIVNNIVELKNAIIESIILNIPSNILCQVNCKGICSKCGCNRNERECECMKKSMDSANPFAILKNFVGGAENGSTKK